MSRQHHIRVFLCFSSRALKLPRGERWLDWPSSVSGCDDKINNSSAATGNWTPVSSVKPVKWSDGCNRSICSLHSTVDQMFPILCNCYHVEHDWAMAQVMGIHSEGVGVLMQCAWVSKGLWQWFINDPAVILDFGHFGIWLHSVFTRLSFFCRFIYYDGHLPKIVAECNTPVSYFGALWFKSRPGDRLYWLTFCVVFLSPPGKCWESTLN